MQFFMFIFGAIGLYDGFTTVIGTHDILGGSMIVAIAFAVIILAFIGGTAFIWEDDFFDSDFLQGFLRIMWFIALGYDLYTSYKGNLIFVMGGRVNNEQIIILVGVTALVSASPVIFSYLMQKYNGK